MSKIPFDIIATKLRFLISPVVAIEAGAIEASERFRAEWSIDDINSFHLSFRNWGDSTGRTEEWRTRIANAPDRFFGQFLLSEQGPGGPSWGLEVNLSDAQLDAMKNAVQIIGFDSASVGLFVSRTDFTVLGGGHTGALIVYPPRIAVQSVDDL